LSPPQGSLSQEKIGKSVFLSVFSLFPTNAKHSANNPL